MNLNLVEFTLTQFQLYLLVMFRMTGIIITAPFFANAAFPEPVKIGLGMLIALVLFPLIQTNGVYIPQQLGAFLVAAGVELGMGLILGLVASFIFAGIQLGGQLVSQQMGITIADVIDPVSNTNISVVSQYQILYVSLLFIIFGGPNYLIVLFLKSFTSVPVTGFLYTQEMVNIVTGPMAGDMFDLAIKSGAPAMVALLVATVAMGFIARTVPEMNIFIIGFTMRLGMGLIILWLTVDMFTYIFRVYMRGMFLDLYQLLGVMG